MALHAGKSAPKRRYAFALVLSFLCLLAGGEIARRAVFGQGHWHAWAKTLYQRYKTQQKQKVLAEEVPLERAGAPLVIYNDHLDNGWSDWSWAAHRLNAVITMTPEGYKGVYLHHDPLGTDGYGMLQIFVRGQAALKVGLVDENRQFQPQVLLSKYLAGPPDPRSGWAVARIPLADLGVLKYDAAFTGIVFQSAKGEAQQPVSLARISLLPDPSLPTAPTHATVAITVDVHADRHLISPLIYGMAFAPPAYLSDLRLPLNRWGGNDKSRYNWMQGNADNAARDWQWRNRWATDGLVPPGPSSAADKFVRDNRAASADTLLTVPTLGWVARDSDNGHASQNVPGTGGAPLAGAHGAIAGYDPTDNRTVTSVRSVAHGSAPDVVAQDEWVRHLVTTFGAAARGGVHFYAMDNEPDLWDYTHTDVHPAQMGYDDVLANFLDYAVAVKATDPTAQVTGPVVSGWTGYRYSALDRGTDNFHTHADSARHGGGPFLAWFLRQVHAHDQAVGKRTLDVLDVHYYPQGQGVYSPQDDPSTQARRLRSTRSLWDPAYVDESWIGEPVRLIPRMNDWITQSYPGTKLGITEWNFGSDQAMDGGLAIADVLGIYGREGVFLANYWAYPMKDTPGYLAFKLYRNVDGRGRGFGDLGCRAVSANQSRVSCYAARDVLNGDLTLMLINKMPRATVTTPLTLSGLSGDTHLIKTWQCGADNPKKIITLADISFTGSSCIITLPPYSMTLLRIMPPGKAL